LVILAILQRANALSVTYAAWWEMRASCHGKRTE